MENITYQSYRQEIKDLIENAIGECMGECSDLDELREKVDECLHETIDGHEWVIYYAQAHELCEAVRRCDRQAYNRAYDDLRDLGGDKIGPDEDIDNLYVRLAYSILRTGCNDAYESELESFIENNCAEWKETGKRWAEGIKQHNSTREEAYEAEKTARSYSPFEFTAQAINSLPWSVEAWEAFQEGIDETFSDLICEADVDYWLCPDCTVVAANSDYTGLDYHYDEAEAEERKEVIDKGLEA